MKRVLSLVLALSMVLGMFSFAFAGSNLKDIAGTDYEAAVEALVELGVVNGYTDGTFLPEKVVTRAEMAKLLVVSAGLEPAADVAKGATRFSDVAGSHWASGYVNVAAEYGYIVGYPDGTFAPDKTVTYAEAVTMAIRVLGYRTVVESKGTWPTNYIAKATELKTLDDISYGSYSDGAKRGNVAKLIWNMLRTKVWDIDSENETNGLTSKQQNKTMIDKYFENYTYLDEDDDAYLVSVDIAEDGEVTATIAYGEDGDYAFQDYELVGGDLLRMVKDMKVLALVNTKTKTIHTLINNDTMVEGRIDEDGKIDGTKYNFGNDVPAEDDYIVAIVDGKDVIEYVILPEEGSEELDEDAIEDILDDDEDLEVIYLIDGSWATAEDLEEGDVITEVDNLEGSAVAGAPYYVVAREEVKGTYKAYVTRGDDEFVKVDKTEYAVSADTVFYKYSESKEKDVKITNKAEYSGKNNDYIDEDVRLVLDYLGNVVSVYFDEPTSKTAGSINWFILTGSMWSVSGKDGTKYYATLTDMNNNEDDYEVDKDSFFFFHDVQGSVNILDILTDEFLDQNDDGDYEISGDILPALVYAMYEKNGKLYAADVDDDGYLVADIDDEDAVGEFYAESVTSGEEAILDKDTNYLANGQKVGRSSQVITITPVIDEDEVVGLDITISEGAKELEGVKCAYVASETIVETNETSGKDEVTDIEPKIAYAFVAETGSSSELSFGKVEVKKNTSAVEYKENGKNYILVDGTPYEVAGKDAGVGTLVEGSYIAWTTKDDKITIKAQLRVADLDDEAVVTKVKDEMITIKGSGVAAASEALGLAKEGQIDLENDVDALEDVRFILVNATTPKNDDKQKEVKFGAYEDLGEGVDDLEFQEYDRLQMSKVNGDTIIVIIRSSAFNEDTELVDGLVNPGV